jgi:hypothetical protein
VTAPPRKPLGMQWVSRGGASTVEAPPLPPLVVNTRSALWPERWPAIALQECVDKVEASPPELQSQVKFDLPCKACPKNTACLNAKRKELGPLMYDREILTKPRSSESSLFPYELFAPMLMRDQSLIGTWVAPYPTGDEFAIVQAWDFAWSEKVGGDWLVCMTGYVHLTSGRRHLIDVQRWQRLTFDEQCELIARKHYQARSDLVVLEGDAAQSIYKKHMAATTPVPVVQHNAGDGKNSLAKGVPALLILLENRKWEFPYAPGYHREELDVFLAEMEAFGWVDGKLQGVGEHDDTVMAFWHLNWGMDQFVSGGVSEQHRGV